MTVASEATATPPPAAASAAAEAELPLGVATAPAPAPEEVANAAVRAPRRVAAHAIAWYAAAFLGASAALLLGFGASAGANRIGFAVWGLGLALAWVLMLRWGFVGRWPPLVTTGRLLLVFGFGLTIFARLEARAFEALDLGVRAVFPRLYAPFLTRPQTATSAALGLAVAGALVLVVGRHLPSTWLRPPAAGPQSPSTEGPRP